MTYSRNPSRSWGSDYQKRNLTPFHLLSFCILISKCDQLKWSSSSHKIYTIFPNAIVSLTITKPSCKFCEWASLHKVTALTITSEDIWRLESQGKSSLHRREMCNDGTERQPQRREIRQQHVLHGSIVPKIPAKLSPSHFWASFCPTLCLAGQLTCCQRTPRNLRNFSMSSKVVLGHLSYCSVEYCT